MHTDNLNILNALPAHIAVLDGEGRIVWVNDAWMNFARQHNASELVALGIGVDYLEMCEASDQYQQEDTRAEITGIRAVIAGEIPEFHLEYPCDTPTQRFWFEMSALPTSGELPGAVVSHFDITDRKNSDLQRAGFNQIFQQSLNEIFVFDATTLRFLRVNEGAQRNLGYTESELQALTPVDIKPFYSLEDFIALVKPLVNGEKERLEFDTVHRRKDGTDYSVEIHLQKQQFEGKDVFVAIVLDITERQVTSAALAQARLFLESAPDAMLIVNHSGKLISANSQAEKLFEYSRHQLLTMNVDDLVPVAFREKHVAHRSGFSETPRVRSMGASQDLFALTGNGNEIPIEVSLSPIKTAEGLLVTAAIRDVTQQREIAEILKQSKQAAEDATETKTRFLAAASHDLRQPLQSIALYLSSLTRLLENPKAVEISGKIRSSVDSMGEILEVLLDISKFDSGAVVPDFQSFPVQQLFDQLIADNIGFARQRGITLRCIDSDCILRSDEGLLLRILGNLITNALRYTESGAVELRCIVDGNLAMLEVIDTGVGIAEVDLRSIFEEYYQVGNSVRNRDKGLGLGLSIVKIIARILDHPVRVVSEPGVGSTFSVEVPIADSIDQNPVECGQTDREVAGTNKEVVVLFVDDDPAIVDGIHELFDLLDMQLVTAESGEEAMKEIAAGLTPDILVSDFRLPCYSGLELVRKIRGEVSPDLPAIIMTGDTAAKEIVQSAEGNIQFFHKPVNIDALLAHIEEATS